VGKRLEMRKKNSHLGPETLKIGGFNCVFSDKVTKRGAMYGIPDSSQILPKFLVYCERKRPSSPYGNISEIPRASFSDVHAGEVKIVDESEEFMCIRDNNRPLFKLHFHVLPKETVKAPEELNFSHIPMLQRMRVYIDSLIERISTFYVGKIQDPRFQYGYHESPKYE